MYFNLQSNCCKNSSGDFDPFFITSIVLRPQWSWLHLQYHVFWRFWSWLPISNSSWSCTLTPTIIIYLKPHLTPASVSQIVPNMTMTTAIVPLKLLASWIPTPSPDRVLLMNIPSPIPTLSAIETLILISNLTSGLLGLVYRFHLHNYDSWLLWSWL